MGALFQLMVLIACGSPAQDASADDAGPADVGAVDVSDPNARSCESLSAELSFEAQARTICSETAGCVAWRSPLCEGPAACWASVSEGAPVGLDALATARAGACAREVCECPPAPTAACDEGRCVFPACPYTCDLRCPCAVDEAGCDVAVCAAGTCTAIADCTSQPPPENCDGQWDCERGRCVFRCAPTCAYTCDLSCRCAVGADGCDLPECDLSCVDATICDDLPHAPCDGHWVCVDGTCVWRCDDDVCGRIAAELEAARVDIAACDGDAVCKAADNQLCGNVGGCYTFYRDDADFELVRLLERAYREARCFRPFCDHCPPPPAAACVRGRCAAAP